MSDKCKECNIPKAYWPVYAERERQDIKWGEQNHNDLYWLGILMEEVGELSKEIIENGIGGKSTEKKIRGELIQTVAVAIGWLECLNRHGRCPEVWLGENKP